MSAGTTTKLTNELSEAAPEGYELLERIGAGSFGDVYRARQRSTEQAVAIKFLRCDQQPEEERRRQVARFLRETEICAELHHPHIVRILDRGETGGGRVYAVFELVPGETLAERLQRPLLPAEAAALMSQVLDALACVHGSGVVHRDLKPSNIMVTSTGSTPNAKLLDFGVGMFAPGARKANFAELTHIDESLGTPSYSAPEQLRGEPASAASDLYAWGLIFLECLLGRPVIRGRTLAEVFHQQLDPREIPLPPAIAAHPISGPLRRALIKDPRRRVRDARALHRALSEVHIGDLVGGLDSSSNGSGLGKYLQAETAWSQLPGQHATRRQVTIVSCSIRVVAAAHATVDLDLLDAVQLDQRNLLVDEAARFGAYLAGQLGERLLFYFGYPHASDTAARQAGRAALQMAELTAKYATSFAREHGIRLEYRAGIHTGLVLVEHAEAVAGVSASIATRVEAAAPAGGTLVTDAARRLLERHFQLVASDVAPASVDQDATLFTLRDERESPHTGDTAAWQQSHFVGRQPELAALTSAWEQVKGSHGQAILITGDAGLGKSRLLRELVARIREDGAPCLDCACDPAQRNSALYPILQLLRRLLGLTASLSGSEARARLDAALQRCAGPRELLLPIFCAWLGLGQPEHSSAVQLSPGRQKELLLQASRELLLQVGGPCALLIEDLHDADPTTLEFLDGLLAQLHDLPVLLLLSARPGIEHSWVRPPLTYELAPLSQDELVALTRGLVGELDSKVSVWVSQRTDGVPLFVEELLHALRESGVLVMRDGRYVMDGTASAIPITLRDLLMARLDHAGLAQETAQLAAVVGVELDAELLLAISLRDSSVTEVDLAVLLETGVLERRSGSTQYAFRHALLREVAYESMPEPTRAEAHQRVAEALEQRQARSGRALHTELSQHWAAAGEYPRAVQHGLRATQAALKNATYFEAAEHAQSVLRWTAKLPAEQRAGAELEARDLLTKALMATRGWANDAVKSEIDRCTQLLELVSNAQLVSSTRWALMTYHYVACNRAELERLSSDYLVQAQRTDDLGQRVAAHMFCGLVQHGSGHYAQAAASLQLSRDLYVPERDRSHAELYGLDTYAWATATLALVRWCEGKPSLAYELADHAVKRARELNHPPTLGIALLYAGNLDHYAQDKPRLIEHMQELLALAHKYDLPAYLAYGALLKAWAEDDAALPLPILQQLDGMGCRAALTYYGALRADTLAAHGELDAALAGVRECLAGCAARNERYYEAELRRLEGMYLLQREDTEAAFAALTSARDLARAQHADGLVAAAERGLAAAALVDATRRSGEPNSLEDIPA